MSERLGYNQSNMQYQDHGTGAFPSPLDLRLFKFAPKVDLASAIQLYEGGEIWGKEYIDDQHALGICTSISLTMKAKRYFNIDFSPDFQYLLQKKFKDINAAIGWGEGSSAYHSILCGYQYGLLPKSEWKHTTEADRKLPYSKYVKKLQTIPDEEIERLLEIAKQYKVTAFAQTPVERDAMAGATLKCDGLLVRFEIDESWYTRHMKGKDKLSKGSRNRSGHIINDVRFAGGSRRVVNSWGTDWADNGTAYYHLNEMRPTEAWSVWFGEFPPEIQKQKADQEKLIGKLRAALQRLVILYRELLSK